VSIMKQDQTKIVLPRTGPDEFWRLVHRHYAADDPLKWKYLGMLALRENAGWPLLHIGLVFGHSKGHVLRCLVAIKRELRQRFDLSPEFLRLDSADEAEEMSNDE
jgi:hypothetical protein